MENDKKVVIKVRAVILNEGKLLTVRHNNNSGFMALPGGHLEKDEDVKECLEREIIEELGVKPQVGRLLYINTFLDGDKQYLELFFEVKNGADYLDTEKLVRTHAHEITEIIWVKPNDDIAIRPKSFAEDFKTGKTLSDEIKYIQD